MPARANCTATSNAAGLYKRFTQPNEDNVLDQGDSNPRRLSGSDHPTALASPYYVENQLKFAPPVGLKSTLGMLKLVNGSRAHSREANMTKSLRWGILGTGNIAAKFADQLNNASPGELVASGSRNQSSADQFAEQHGGKGYGSYEGLLADPNVEAIYVSLPNSLHAPWSIAGLEAGKHVLCEKPLAATTAEVEQMFAAADASGKQLMEAFMYRQHPVVKEVLDELHGGLVGNIKIIRSHFTYQRPDSAKDIRYQPELGGGGLLDVGCYCINFMRAIAGCQPESMQVQIHQHQTGVDDIAVGTLKFPNDILGVFSCGMTVQADRTTTVAGSDGYLQIDTPWFSAGSYQVVRGEETEHRQVGKSEMLYALEADHFADVIAGNAAPLISRQDSLGNAQVLEALLQQIEATS